MPVYAGTAFLLSTSRGLERPWALVFRTPVHLAGNEFGRVHMNGRIYDPLLGRFLSADIVVQAPANLQSYNR